MDKVLQGTEKFTGVYLDDVVILVLLQYVGDARPIRCCVEKECLAIFLGIIAFEIYLLGRQFIIQTDHRALTWLNKFPRLTW